MFILTWLLNCIGHGILNFSTPFSKYRSLIDDALMLGLLALFVGIGLCLCNSVGSIQFWILDGSYNKLTFGILYKMHSMPYVIFKCVHKCSCFSVSEKDDEEGEKREEPRDNSEEAGGGMDKTSGPWNRSAPTQTLVAEIIGKLWVLFSGSIKKC